MIALIKHNLRRLTNLKCLLPLAGGSLLYLIATFLHVISPDIHMFMPDILNYILVFFIAVAAHLMLRSNTANNMLVPRMTVGLTRTKVYLAELFSVCIAGLVIWAVFFVPLIIALQFIPLYYEDMRGAETIPLYPLVGCFSVLAICALCTLLELNVKNRFFTMGTGVVLVLLYYLGWLPVAMGMPAGFESILGVILHFFPPIVMDFGPLMNTYVPLVGELWEYALCAGILALLLTAAGIVLFRKRDLK